MATKKRSGITRFIRNIFFLVPSLFSLITNMIRLIGYEAQLAGRSLIIIVVLCIFLATLLTSTWLCLLSMLFVYLISYLNLIVSLGIIFLLNLFLMLVVGIILARTKKNLLFPETRRQFSHLSQFYEED